MSQSQSKFFDYLRSNKEPSHEEGDEHSRAQDENIWQPVVDNVWKPMVNGSGVLQVYNTFAEKPVELYRPPQAGLGSQQWMLQSLCEAVGAIGPYVVAGKLMGKGMGMAGKQFGATGNAARFFASESAAQILGAGAYDALKKPNAGETRLSNALGGMAGFAVFEGGNKFVNKYTTRFEIPVERGTARAFGRFGVGMIGGLSSGETSHFVAGLQGIQDHSTFEDRLHGMLTGGFVNMALPLVQHGTNIVVDHAINSRSWGPGIPISRYLDYHGYADPELVSAAEKNPLARVKHLKGPEVETRADVRRNRVELSGTDGPAQLAHELKHLQLARAVEPLYKAIGEMAKSDPVRAEQAFYQLRSQIEVTARQTENAVRRRQSGEKAAQAIEDPIAISEQTAANGSKYKDIWRDEWKAFKADPTWRPRYEYNGTSTLEGKNESGNPNDALLAANGAAGKVLGFAEPLGATVTSKGINFAVRSEGATGIEVLIFPDADAITPSQVYQLYETRDAVAVEKLAGAESKNGNAEGTSRNAEGSNGNAEGKPGEASTAKTTTTEASTAKSASESNGPRTFCRFVEGLPAGTLYLLRASGPYEPAKDGTRFNSNMALLDPYANAVTGETKRPRGYDTSNPDDPTSHLRPRTTDNLADMPKCVATGPNDFDWGSDRPPNRPIEETNILEINVRGYTARNTELGSKAGTIRGFGESLQKIADDGHTMIQVNPLGHFDRFDWPHTDPVTHEPLQNAWGYNTLAFKAPASHLAHDGTHGQQINETKFMVKQAHELNLEVVLDFVPNHSGEGDHKGPTICFRGLDNNVYFLLQPGHPQFYENHSGCGNTFNCNHPNGVKLLTDTMKYWVQEMHFDGFRFDLASLLNFDADGQQKAETPILKAIKEDPVLSKVKLIAEPWSPANYRVGMFGSPWYEQHDIFRDTVRKFVKGDTGQVGTLADVVVGSPEKFKEPVLDAEGKPIPNQYTYRLPINFVTAHDGFTLYDLVAYNSKHNEANGEYNRDGNDSNYSWNCGVEGPVETASIPEHRKTEIEAFRRQQMKNFLTFLYLSRGIPMELYCDSEGLTGEGNNNKWCQRRLNERDPQRSKQYEDVDNFKRGVIGIRTDHRLGYLQPKDVVWHGTTPFKPDFSAGARFIAWQLGQIGDAPRPLYIASNSWSEPIGLKLPPDIRWRRLIDTGLPSGQDLVPSSRATRLEHDYQIKPYTTIVLEGEPISSGSNK